MSFSESLLIRTPGRGVIEITGDVNAVVARSGIAAGVCHVFVHHTSASLMVCENADPGVLRDMEAFMARLVPDGDRLFEHTAEGPDDMPAHVRSVLTQTTLARTLHECARDSRRGLDSQWISRPRGILPVFPRERNSLWIQESSEAPCIS